MAIIVEFKRLQILNIAKTLPKRTQKFKVLYTLSTTINTDRNTRNTQYKPLVAIFLIFYVIQLYMFIVISTNYHAMMHDLLYK